MRKKKSVDYVSKYKINFDVPYLIKLLPIGQLNRKEEFCDLVRCNIELMSDGYTIRASHEGYQTAYFYVEYFNWLLYTKEIVLALD